MSDSFVFREEDFNALMDMQVRNAAEISALKDLIVFLLCGESQERADKAILDQKTKYMRQSQRLKELLFEHYGRLNIADLLNP